MVSSLDLSVCVLVREGARRRGEETEGGGGGRSRNSSAATAEEEDRRRRSGEAETRPGRGDSGRPPRAGQCEKQRAGDAAAAAAPPTSAPCVASLPRAAPQVSRRRGRPATAGPQLQTHPAGGSEPGMRTPAEGEAVAPSPKMAPSAAAVSGPVPGSPSWPGRGGVEWVA